MSQETRRDFLKKSALIAGATGLSAMFPDSITRAFAIDPAPGSTYLDAEHVVMLMLENRSFDHCFGTLKGVRGFNDPRVITQPDGNPVWLQSDATGRTYAPFRLNINDTNSAWTVNLPHTRESQVDAFNHAKFDKWLVAKHVTNKKFPGAPMALGYYNREDLPFNYAMADAFTICDQNFCSGITSTHPNRLFFWTGTIRDPRDLGSPAYIRNDDLKTGKETWLTFPERLEEHGVSWKVYQNDLSSGGGFSEEERDWLSNYNCNPLEFFPRYNVKFSARNVKSLATLVETLPAEIAGLEKQASAAQAGSDALTKIQVALKKKQEVLTNARAELARFSPENFERLTKKQKNLYNKAFTINKADPDFHKLSEVSYEENGKQKSFRAPKGDLFYQFRKDVDSGKLPTVSWMVAPHYFSDHPSMPMYGPWYISELLDILTRNKEVWKKTIFIVTYDENDGFFDHVPPFTPPDITRPNSGKCSNGINPAAEFITLEQDLVWGIPERSTRSAPIGLGYRVPLLIASPWSRGGKVCSEVFDHTSSLRFLETFLNKKHGLKIREDNISAWRRAVCGDLTSSFSPYNGQPQERLPFLKRDPFIENILNARFKPDPGGFHLFTPKEIAEANSNPLSSPFLPKQEKGVALSSALPYELYVDGGLTADGKTFILKMTAANKFFGTRAAGSPFSIYVPKKFRSENGAFEMMRNWQYAVSPGDTISDSWDLTAFEEGKYHLTVFGPNGYFREFKGNSEDPKVEVNCAYDYTGKDTRSPKGNVAFDFKIAGQTELDIEITDPSYGKPPVKIRASANRNTIELPLAESFGWYDFMLRIEGYPEFERRYAGRVEAGKQGFTDPLIGKVV
jgi:phospholipase C